VSSDERLRLFLALRLPDDVLGAIERWQREELPSVRAVPREHLHVTLAFLGLRPAGELEAIADALREAAAGAGEIRLTPVRYRETRSVGMLVLEDEGGRAALLAGDLQERLERLQGYRKLQGEQAFQATQQEERGRLEVKRQGKIGAKALRKIVKEKKR